MHSLDDPNIYKKLDQGNSYVSIAALADQCEQAWSDVSKLTFSDHYRGLTSILFAGMGGSAYGARIVKSLFSDSLTVPVDIVNDYHLPSYTNQDTLVVAASYSGTTEETISCANEAIAKQVPLIGICNGGPLGKLLSDAKAPAYIFMPTHNPSGQPRLGQGYMQAGQIAMLSSLGYLKVDSEALSSCIGQMRKRTEMLSQESQFEKNPAKQLAQRIVNKEVLLIGSGFLEGAIAAIRNPFHETGKHMAHYYIVPELNHHLMEGLRFPQIQKQLAFVLIHSSLYETAIQKRMSLTGQVVGKNNVETVDIHLSFEGKLAQVFELIQLGSFVTFYLAMLHGVDPAKIPWVDYFKKKLKE